jgi:hypothetical protein
MLFGSTAGFLVPTVECNFEPYASGQIVCILNLLLLVSVGGPRHSSYLLGEQ